MKVAALRRELKVHWSDLLVYGLFAYVIYHGFLATTRPGLFNGLLLLLVASFGAPLALIWASARTVTIIPGIIDRQRREELTVTMITAREVLVKSLLPQLRYHFSALLVFFVIIALGRTEIIQSQPWTFTGSGYLDEIAIGNRLVLSLDATQLANGFSWLFLVLGATAMVITCFFTLTRRACTGNLDRPLLYAIHVFISILLSAIPVWGIYIMGQATTYGGFSWELPVCRILPAASFALLAVALTIRSWRSLVSAYFTFD